MLFVQIVFDERVVQVLCRSMRVTTLWSKLLRGQKFIRLVLVNLHLLLLFVIDRFSKIVLVR